MKNIADDNFEIKNLIGKNFVYIWASWCGPCKKISPVVESYAEKYPDTFYKIDADENPEFVKKYSILSVPTILFVVDGKIMDRHIGSNKFDSFIKNNI